MTAPEGPPRDLPARGAAAALGGIYALLLVAAGLVALLLAWVAAEHPAEAPRPTPRPPAPNLEVTPRADRLRIEAGAKARLRGGATRRSIEQAMAEISSEGWRDPPAASSSPDAGR